MRRATSADRLRLVFCSNYPLPYHTPILNQLSSLVDLHVVYMSRSHALDRAGSPVFADPFGESPTYDFSFHWARAVTWRAKDLRAQISAGVSMRLQQLMPDVVMFSSWGPLTIEPILWKRLRGRRALMWAESAQWSGVYRGHTSNYVRRLIIQATDAFVSNGSAATRFLRDLGVSENRIVTSCLPARCAGTVERYEGPQPHYIFVGRLTARKRPAAVVRAFAGVLTSHPSARLTVVGEGSETQSVMAAAATLGNAVRVVGKLEGAALQDVYRSGDVLVLPARREVWGLVVNEALAHGLFVVASDEVGSSADLLDRSSGLIVPVGDDDALADALLQAALEPQNVSSREARARRVAHCTPTNFARAIHAAATTAAFRGQT